MQFILICSVILNFVFLIITEILYDQYIILKSSYFDTAKPIGKYYFLTCKDISALKKMLLNETEKIKLESSFGIKYIPDNSFNKAKHADLVLKAIEKMQKRDLVEPKKSYASEKDE